MFQNCTFLHKDNPNLNELFASIHGFWGYAENWTCHLNVTPEVSRYILILHKTGGHSALEGQDFMSSL